jgi:hypothetical protein
MYDNRLSLSGEVKADIEQFLASAKDANCAWSGARILPVEIRRNIKLAEAPSYGKTIFEYDNSCNGAQDYRKAAQFIHTGRIQEAIENAEVAEKKEEVLTAEKPPIQIVEINESKPQTKEQPVSQSPPLCESKSNLGEVVQTNTGQAATDAINKL